MFPIRVRLLGMCKGELSAKIAKIMAKYLSSSWKWQKRDKEKPPLSPAIL